MKFFKTDLTAGSLLENEHELLMKRIENSELMSKSKVARLFAPLPKVENDALVNKTSKENE